MFVFLYNVLLYFSRHFLICVFCVNLVVQNRITAFWFRDKELAMAFGFTISFSRLGSVLNFLLTTHIDEAFGLQWTLWTGESIIELLIVFSKKCSCTMHIIIVKHIVSQPSQLSCLVASNTPTITRICCLSSRCFCILSTVIAFSYEYRYCISLCSTLCS